MNDKKLLSDDKGNPSSMRLMSFLALCIAGLLALSMVMGWGSTEGNKQTELVLYFLIAAFAPKAIQKFAEVHDKTPTTKTKNSTNA